MFADRVRIFIKSGKGGDGHVSFRRELYVPAGGPDGGNGGHGGDIIFMVDKGLNTLGDFRHNSKYIAESGEEGGKRRCTGKDGEDLIIKVPEGTVIYDDESGKVIADMSGDNLQETILKGGRGGKGNMNYATSTMQAPQYAQPGQDAQELWVRLELKVIADVGLVGFPNVGKSTFINSFTGRKSAKTGNKPGVTKGKQWIRINGSVELLDTPGILWPKIEDRNVGERLAMIGSINDQILNIEELALETIKFLKKNYQPQLYSRYDITEDIFDNVDTETMMNPENAAALCIMEHIARKRGCIKKGSDIDYEKCAACILDDFREGKIGNISLERP